MEWNVVVVVWDGELRLSEIREERGLRKKEEERMMKEG